jgi:hypothetical protein
LSIKRVDFVRFCLHFVKECSLSGKDDASGRYFDGYLAEVYFIDGHPPESPPQVPVDGIRDRSKGNRCRELKVASDRFAGPSDRLPARG